MWHVHKINEKPVAGIYARGVWAKRFEKNNSDTTKTGMYESMRHCRGQWFESTIVHITHTLKACKENKLRAFFIPPFTAAPVPWERWAPARHQEQITSGALHSRTFSAWKNLEEIQEVISTRKLVSLWQSRCLLLIGSLMIWSRTP